MGRCLLSSVANREWAPAAPSFISARATSTSLNARTIPSRLSSRAVRGEQAPRQLGGGALEHRPPRGGEAPPGVRLERGEEAGAPPPRNPATSSPPPSRLPPPPQAGSTPVSVTPLRPRCPTPQFTTSNLLGHNPLENDTRMLLNAAKDAHQFLEALVVFNEARTLAPPRWTVPAPQPASCASPRLSARRALPRACLLTGRPPCARRRLRPGGQAARMTLYIPLCDTILEVAGIIMTGIAAVDRYLRSQARAPGAVARGSPRARGWAGRGESGAAEGAALRSCPHAPPSPACFPVPQQGQRALEHHRREHAHRRRLLRPPQLGGRRRGLHA